jgi:phosphatidylinositol-3-phosphatase
MVHRPNGLCARVVALSLIILASATLVLATPSVTGSLPTATASVPIVAGAAAPQPIQHVVLIVLENEVANEVSAHGPYERYLAAHYGQAADFYAACHPSAPNYLAMISAETLQCNSDNWNNYTSTNLGDLFGAAGDSWHAYAENLPKSACSSPGTSTAGAFAVRHVPFLYFANVTRNQTYCHQHVLSSVAFNSSVASGKLGNFSFYTPNLCDDGHNGCGRNTSSAQMTRQADMWLKDFLSPILNHTGRYHAAAEQDLVNHTAFIVTWDEGTGSNAGYHVKGISHGNNFSYCSRNHAMGDAACGGRIYFVVVSPYSLHRTFTSADSDYGIDATVEWLFGLPHLGNPGHYDSMAGFPVMSGLFSFRRN